MTGKRPPPPLRARRTALPAPLAFAGAALLVLATAGWLIVEENGWPNILHAATVSGALLAALTFLSRRAFTSSLVVCALAFAVLGIAETKRRLTDFTLHAWDLFRPSDWSFPLSDMAREAPGPAVMAAVALATLVLGAPLAWRAERPNVARGLSAALCAVMVALAGWAAREKGEPRQTQYTWEDKQLSSFYSSWPETLEALARGGLFETGARDGGPHFEPAPACAPERKPPHVILIHQESVTPPTEIPGAVFDPAMLSFFASHDGARRTMKVETYGGASWLTEFSILTGMSSRFFGGLRQFVQVYMAGRTQDALPAALARCGYVPVMFYPYLKGFFGSGRFFESVGFPEIVDMKAQKAPTTTEADSFYYANMLDRIASHVAGSKAPLFVFLETMSAHWPYDVAVQPGREVPGGGPGSHPELHQYLRRLSMARLDYDAMKAALKARFPGEAFLIVHYGDHHPLATRWAFGFADDDEVEEINRRLPPDSPAWRTYYAVDAVGFRPPPTPDLARVDAAWLGAILMEQAGLPLPDSWRERARLMRACQGAYADCPDRRAILAFHRRLVDSGLVRAR